MNDARTLLRALTWFSPAFPTGAFSYSHGLEGAVEAGLVRDAATLESWVADILERGGGWNDAVLLAAAWRGEAVGELARSLLPTRELELESLAQGAAFARAAGLPPAGGGGEPLPLAVARAARGAGLPLDAALQGCLHALAASLVSAGVRLIPLGQTAGVAALLALEAVVAGTAARAAAATLDDLGGACLTVEWCSMRHETQYTRLFRS